MEHPTLDEVLGSVQALDYPADKDVIVAAAERAGAPERVLKALRAIPPLDYRSPDELVQSVPVDPYPDNG